MESITRNVRDISQSDKLALEHVTGRQLVESQQIIIQIYDSKVNADNAETGEAFPGSLPDWCHVYAGLSDNELDSLEKSVLQRADLSRVTD